MKGHIQQRGVMLVPVNAPHAKAAIGRHLLDALSSDEGTMTTDDTMYMLTGFAVLLAMMLFAAAWLHTFSEWESTWRALVAPVRGQGSRPSPIIIAAGIN